MNIEHAIEMLQCAELNCDNVTRLGVVGVTPVKMQVQSALKSLDASLVTKDIEDGLLANE